MSKAGFLKSLRAGKPSLFMLDFDGTLAAIRRNRHHARLNSEWRRLLQSLVGVKGLRVAFISGRKLADLRRLTPFKDAWWVGNHGLDWNPSRLGPAAGLKAHWRRRAKAALRSLTPLQKAYPGLDIDAKGLDISLHLRALRPARQQNLLARLDPMLKRHHLQVHRGRKVLELRPVGGWNKGTAVSRLIRTLPRGMPCLFAGDDRTDEDGFRALGTAKAHLSFKIGHGPSAAMQKGGRRDLLALIRTARSILAKES